MSREHLGDSLHSNSPAFLPVLSSVSATISSRILLKSKNFSPGRWSCDSDARSAQASSLKALRARLTNSPHSSWLLALSEVGSDPASPVCDGPISGGSEDCSKRLTLLGLASIRRRPVDQLKDERTTGDDTGCRSVDQLQSCYCSASGFAHFHGGGSPDQRCSVTRKVSSVLWLLTRQTHLQNGGLSAAERVSLMSMRARGDLRGLRSNDSNLRQVDGVGGQSGRGEGVLKLIDCADESLHDSSAVFGWMELL